MITSSLAKFFDKENPAGILVDTRMFRLLHPFYRIECYHLGT
jgi:hypothetical protein